MKLFRKIVAVGGMWMLFVSCQGEQEAPAALTEDYFDVRALLAEHMEQLRQEEALLEKKASFAGEVEKNTIELDAAALTEEFEVFREVDINKPEFRDRYIESREVVDGMEVITYEADDKESLNVNYLRIYLDSNSGKVEQLEALFSNKNVLYNSTRLLNLYFGPVGDQFLPEAYTIEGNQKMIFSDKESFRIEADFIYPE